MAALIVSMALGVGLYAAPDLLGYEGPARISHLIVGPIVASLSFIAIADVARELRWVNFVLGAWLVLSPLVLPHEPAALFAGVSAGMAITALAIVRGPTNQRLGGGWRQVVKPDEPTEQTQRQGGNRDADT